MLTKEELDKIFSDKDASLRQEFKKKPALKVKIIRTTKVTDDCDDIFVANNSGIEDSALSNLCHMISAMPFVPSQQTVHIFETVFRSCTDQHSEETSRFLDYIQDNFIGRTGGQKGHIPVHLWSQFEAVFGDEDTCQSILLEGLKKTLQMESDSSQEELVWATIGRFGLEEELQAMGWKEALLEV